MEPRGANPDVESLLAQSRAGVYVVQDGRFVYTNPRLAEIFGVDLSTLYALPSVLELVSEADRPRVVETMRQRISGEVDAVQYTWRGVRRDGTAVDVEVLANRIEYGGRPAVGGTMLDATDRLRRERELVERESRLRSLIESTQDVVFTCDFDGVITSINPAGEQLAAFGAGSTVGRSILDAVEPSTRDATRGLLRDIRTGERDGTYEVPLVTPGGPHMLELTLRVVLREGEPVGDRRHRARRHRAEAAGAGAAQPHARGRAHRAVQPARLPDAGGAAPEAGASARRRACSCSSATSTASSRSTTRTGMPRATARSPTPRVCSVSRFRSADIIARLGGDEFTVFPLEATDESADLLM